MNDQIESQRIARNQDRINTQEISFRKISQDQETINQLILQLADENQPIEQRIETFSQFCSSFIFLITEEQANFIMELLVTAISEQNTTNISYFLHVIDIIVQFKEDFNNELFVKKERLDIIMHLIPNINAYSIASFLVSSSLEDAQLIWEYNEELDFKSLVYQPDRTKTAAVSPDQALSFLSSFFYYPEFSVELQEITQSALNLWLVSDSDPRIRFEVLRFLYFAIKNLKEIANFLLHNTTFYTLFQTRPQTSQHMDLVLMIIREMCFQTENPETVVINSNLLPFIVSTITSSDDIFSCYCCDIISDVAEKSNEAGFETMISLGLIDTLWNIIENSSLLCRSCAMSALLRFFYKGNNEIKQYLLEQDIFGQFGDIILCVDEKRARGELLFILQILGALENDGNEEIFSAILSNENFIESLREMDNENTDEPTLIPIRSILSRLDE